MMSQIDKVLAVAYAEVGTKEYPPGSNTVKYNDWLYGKKVSGADYPWCAAFVCWCFDKASLSHLTPITASCVAILQYAKDNKRFVSASELRPGDVVLYKFATNNRAANHVGIVTAVTDKTITAIEGNTSVTSDDNGGAVMVRYRDRTPIVGGFRPKYEIETEEIDMITDEQFEQMYDAMMKWRGEKPPCYTGEVGREYAAAVAAGITDGTRPQAAVTREEAGIMAGRAAEKGKTQ